ncbi:MAG TPA: hypothetical protein VG871_01460, partial [Vicinamibacterales bacterium]|nr:hypothetical protein [Vicinamibacterales bacterium]
AGAVLVVAVMAALLGVATPARAQRRGAPAAGDEPAITPFELQRLFDSYALLQAQEFLKISDDQYTRFLPRFKALQDTRRQAQQQRLRLLNELRTMVNSNQPDEQIGATLKQLADLDERAVADTRKALEGVDQVLDLRQQVKFRLFEEQMERRKLELVTRARRQANRANQ